MDWSPASVYARLPHDLRRAAFGVRRPTEYQELQRRRRGRSTNFADYREFERSQTLFIHVPKAAGLSMWTAVYGRQFTAHVPLSTYRMVFPRRVFEKLFTFAFVRNPWSRIGSAYRFIQMKDHDPLHSDFFRNSVAPYPTLDDFVQESLPRVLSHPLFRSQMHYVGLPGRDGPCVDFLGRYETLAEDFARLATMLDLQTPDLRHFHRTNAEPHSIDLSPESIRLIGDLYRDDVQALGYEAPDSS